MAPRALLSREPATFRTLAPQAASQERTAAAHNGYDDQPQVLAFILAHCGPQ